MTDFLPPVEKAQLLNEVDTNSKHSDGKPRYWRFIYLDDIERERSSWLAREKALLQKLVETDMGYSLRLGAYEELAEVETKLEAAEAREKALKTKIKELGLFLNKGWIDLSLEQRMVFKKWYLVAPNAIKTDDSNYFWSQTYRVARILFVQESLNELF